MQVRTLLVDGTFLLKRSFSSAKNTFNSHGKDIGGLYGFMISLRKYIRENAINKCVVSFDPTNGGKMRYNLYNNYKANRENKEWYNKIQLTEKQIYREEENKTILWQKTRIQTYLEDFHIRQINLDVIESDDVIAHYCKKYHKDEYILIVTNDRDFCQLVDYDNVNIYLSNLKEIINKDNYFMHFKHHYKNACLLKIILGDTSDNISKIKGLSEDKLFEYFPKFRTEVYTIERLLEEAKNINLEKKNNKQTPVKCLDNLITESYADDIVTFALNEQLINLKKPMLTREAISEIEAISEFPMDLSNRGSKNLMNLMNEDEFLRIFNSNFVNFVTPFYPLILREKAVSAKFSE